MIVLELLHLKMEVSVSEPCHGKQTVFFNLKSPYISWLDLSIRIPMLWVSDRYKYFYSYSAGIGFRRRPQTTDFDV